ncbi:hypothetical protein KY362_01625, partial [Candidatus Woesearchaeota archaeon]|nr:hypothetical protein [Candidatus Woesearchaeota archaeon]
MWRRFWLTKEEAIRLRQIVHVLYDNRLGHILARLRLRGKLPVEKNIKKENFKEREITPQLIKKIIEDLDGSFIKLGQLLSLRP